MTSKLHHLLIAVLALAVDFDLTRAAMTATECSGKTFSLYCGSESYIIHVLYDQFSYSADDKCITNPDHCSQAEIIQPISAKYCNGYSRCNFLVPSGHTIELCGNQNATSVTVHYNCVPKHQMVDVCSPYSSLYNSRLFLKSPNYPQDQLNPTKCQCNVTGTNISAQIYEYGKSADSRIVLYFVTDKAIVHVGGVGIRNEILFQNTNHVKLILENSYEHLMFKLWMELTGLGMKISCMDQPVILPTSTTDLYSSFQSENWTQSSVSFSQTDFVYTTINQSKLLSTDGNWLSNTTYLFTSTNPVDLISTAKPNQTDLVQVTRSSSYVLVSSSIGQNASKGDNSRELRNEEDTDIRVIIVTVCVFTIVIIISLSIGIFIYRKNHPREERFHIEENNKEIYQAYQF